MRFIAFLLLCAALAGCNAYSSVSVGANPPPAMPGPGGYTMNTGMYASSSSAAGAALGLAIVAIALYGPGGEGSDLPYGVPDRAPPLDPNRLVNEQDCTKPIVNPGANLRCR